jgi:hypothetical protein
LLIASVRSTAQSSPSHEIKNLKAREQATTIAIQQVLATYRRVCAELDALIKDSGGVTNTGKEGRERGNGDGHFKASIRATQALLNAERDRAVREIRNSVLGPASEAGLSGRKRKRKHGRAGEYWRARALVEASMGELLATGLG